MTCCTEEAVQVSKMALELKSGPMLWYKKRIFGKNWRDVHAVLYNDSTFAWYKDKSRAEQEGVLVIKDAPELIAYGQFTNMVPNRPELPEHYEVKELLAFGVRGKENVFWFLCPNEQEVVSWMTAISNTLPPPPQPPAHLQHATAPEAMPKQHSPPPEYTAQPQLQPPSTMQQPLSNMQQPPHTMLQPSPMIQQPSPVIPGQYPQYRQPYPQPPAYGSMMTRPANNNPGGSNTTVVVQDGRYNSGGGDFAMGMLLGGAIGSTWGHHPGIGWGCGIGWGGGWGHHGTSINDTDIHINNYYDNDTTIVNNDVDVSNAVTYNEAGTDNFAGESENLVADYDDGCDAGGFDGGDFGGDFGDCSDFGF